MITITAQRLRELRENKGYSKSEVAKILGISRPSYINYENGKNKPSRKLKELCALYSVSADYILGTSDTKNKPYINLQQFGHSEISEDEEKIIFFYRDLSAEEQQDMQYYCQLSEAARRRVNRTIRGEYEDMVKEQKSAQESG